MICEFLRRSSQGGGAPTPSQSITIDSASNHSPLQPGANSHQRMTMPPQNMIIKHPEPKITLTASGSERYLQPPTSSKNMVQ